jgi:hypothetical protein
VSAPPSDGAARREISAFALGLVVLTVLLGLFTGSGVLVTRPFWIDEWLGVFVAQRPSPFGAIADVAHGADGGASLFHLVVWALRATIGVAPATLRIVSLACVLGALVFVYALLRRRFSVEAAAAGALAAGAHPLVIAHSYEARFYGPWLLCCALYAWTLSRRQRGETRGRDVAVAVAAFALCTVHFYGVLTLGLMTAAAVAAHGSRWRDGLRLVRGSAGGLVAMLIVVPLALGQRLAYTVPSWLPDFRFPQLVSLTEDFWFAAAPMLATLTLLAAAVLRRRDDGGTASAAVVRGATSDAGLAALLALALMPLALALLSIAGQPSILGRYAIATALAWGPFVALAVELAGRVVARASLVALAGVWFAGYSEQVRETQAFVRSLADARAEYDRARQSGLPVVFQSTHIMYPLFGDEWLRGASPSGWFLDLSDSTTRALFPDKRLVGQHNRGIVLERDLARVHARRWGFPRLAQQSMLDTAPRFLLLAPAGRLPAGIGDAERFSAAVFPHHRVTPVSSDLLVLERPRQTIKPAK